MLGIIPSSWESLTTLILPALTVGLIEIAYIVEHAACLDAGGGALRFHPHGAGEGPQRAWRIIWGHAFKNAVIPVMTIAGIDLGAVMGGAVITETVFNRPGIGLMTMAAALRRDISVLAGGVLYVTFFSSSSPTSWSTSATPGSTRECGSVSESGRVPCGPDGGRIAGAGLAGSGSSWRRTGSSADG